MALARGRRRPLQGGGLGLDAAGGADPAGVGRPGGARPRLRRARAARPLPAAARDDPGRDPLRPHRERARDRALRVDRHAARCSSTGASSFEPRRGCFGSGLPTGSCAGLRASWRPTPAVTGAHPARRRSSRRTRPAGCPAPNEGCGRTAADPIAAVRCFVSGLIAAVLLTCSGVLLVVGRSAHAADATRSTTSARRPTGSSSTSHARTWRRSGSGATTSSTAAARQPDVDRGDEGRPRRARRHVTVGPVARRPARRLLPLDVHRVRPRA